MRIPHTPPPFFRHLGFYATYIRYPSHNFSIKKRYH